MTVTDDDIFAKAFDVEAIVERTARTHKTDRRRLLRNTRAALREGDRLYFAEWPSIRRAPRARPASPTHAATIALFERAWRHGQRELVDDVLEEIARQRFTPVSPDRSGWMATAFADSGLAGQSARCAEDQLEVNWSAAVIDAERGTVCGLARATWSRPGGKRKDVFVMEVLDPPDEPTTPDVSDALLTFLRTLVSNSVPHLVEALRAPFGPGSFAGWASDILPRYFPPGLLIGHGVRPNGVRVSVCCAHFEVLNGCMSLTTRVREEHPGGPEEYERMAVEVLDRTFLRGPPPQGALAIEIIERWKRAAAACLSERRMEPGLAFVPLLPCLADVGRNGRARARSAQTLDRFDPNAIRRFAEACAVGSLDHGGRNVPVLSLPNGHITFFDPVLEIVGGESSVFIQWEFHSGMFECHADPWKVGRLLLWVREVLRAIDARDFEGTPLAEWFGAMDARPVVNPRIDAGFVFGGLDACDHDEPAADFFLKEWVNPCALKA